jgi:hypothetical protein
MDDDINENEMSLISFEELIEEISGVPFNDIYTENLLNYGVSDEQSDME